MLLVLIRLLMMSTDDERILGDGNLPQSQRSVSVPFYMYMPLVNLECSLFGVNVCNMDLHLLHDFRFLFRSMYRFVTKVVKIFIL